MAAPPTATWSGSAGADVIEAEIDALGVDLVGIGVAASDARTGSTVTPRSDAISSNLRAAVVGLPITVASNRQSAPPDAGAPLVDDLLAVNTPLLNIGALSTTDEANWNGDNACVTTGPLARATTEVASVDVLPGLLLLDSVVSLGVSRSEGETGLALNTGLNHGVQSTATGAVDQISILGGAVTVDVLGATTLTATAPGTTIGSVDYNPGAVTVTIGGVETPLTEADPEISVTLVGLGDVTVRLNPTPTITDLSATSVAATSSLLTIEVTVFDPLPLLPPIAEVSVDVLPLQASATAPAGGIDCPPTAPVIVTPAEGATTGPLPAITGTAFPNATVQVFVDGTSIGTTTADAGGNWSITPTTPLTNGPHAATAIQTVAGQSSLTSPPRNFVVDAVAPAPPVIVTPVNGSVTSDSTPNVTGTAEANSTVTVSIDGTVAGTTLTDGAGNWTFTPPSPLTDGPHTAVATATDAVGNVSGPSNTVNFTVDTIAPAAPVVVAPADGSATNDTTPLVTGTAAPNTTVTVFMDGTSIGTTPSDGSGNWSLTSPALAEGSHTVRATSTDAAGNVSPSSPTNTFVVDTTVPVAPVILTPVTGTVTSDNTPTITGTAEANSTVTVRIDGSPAGTAVADGSGNWNFTTGIILDGPHTAAATSTDAAGNVSIDSNTVSFTVDTLAPAPPVIETPVTGTITNDNTPPISGTAEPNSTVTVTIDGIVAGTPTADGSGNWTLTPATLADGPHSAVATSTDAAGNVSLPSNTVSFTVDTAAPLAPLVVNPANGSVTNDTTPLVTGTAEPNSMVTVTIDGDLAGNAQADGAGNWSLVSPVLTEGTHTVFAVSTDAAGNVSPPSPTNTFDVDATAPAPPTVITPADGSVTNDTTPLVTGTAEANATVTVLMDGASIGTTVADGSGNWSMTSPSLTQGTHFVRANYVDGAGNTSADSATNTFLVDSIAPVAPVVTTPANGSITNDTTPLITGTAEANSTVEVFIDDVSVGTAPADGSGAWSLTSPVLTEGSHSVHATSTDAAGNTSVDSNTNTFIVDSVAPAAPVLVTPANGSVTSDNTPDVTGTAEPLSTVTVRIDGVVAGTAPVDALGNWTITTGILLDGPHTAVATASDAAGNVSPDSNTNTFTVDTLDPAPPVIVTPANGSVTGDNTPAITGTAEANSIVTVVIDGTPAGTTTTDSLGNWTFTPPAPLSDGPHSAVATATDAAGNVSPDSNTVTFTVDTVAPAAPVITSPTNGSTTTDTTPPITGTAEPGSTVTVIVDGTPIGTAPTDGNGNWTLTPTTPLPNGQHTITATATDPAGNTGPASAPVVFTIAAAGADSGGLPATGGTIPWPGLLIGSLLVAVGAIAVTARRRRVIA
ncbi:Ig-like domain-containing protein [Microbacterium sp. Root166]|uniref:Ig-like domain-containing protein n=1 Tax=Microbacterium sp. Root166 TaxID=1736478 RepID=UPI0012FA0A77|nr:Ig-like domain-containing protein [Microbacterium sp. Root166]